MYKLSEVVKAQSSINLNKIDTYIDSIILHLSIGGCIRRNDFRENFSDIVEVANNFSLIYDSANLVSSFEQIVGTLEKYNKIFVEKKLSIRQSTQKLLETNRNFYSKLKNSFDEYYDAIANEKDFLESIIDAESDSFTNYVKTRVVYYETAFFNNKLKRNILIFKKRLNSKAEETVYKNIWHDKLSFYNELSLFVSHIKNFYEILETNKKDLTQQLLNQRRSQSLLMHNADDQYHLDHVSQFSSDEYAVEKLKGIFGQYANWKYPVAYIDPNVGELTRYLISGDPFYVIDDRELPYKKLIESLPVESQRKIHLYTRKNAKVFLEDNSIGLCVSWNSFPFTNLGVINKDIELITKILKPGGYVIFNYADAYSYEGAKYIETHQTPVVWKERIDRFLKENNLHIIMEHELNDFPFKIVVCQKEGRYKDLNLINKLGLVLPNQELLIEKRIEEKEKKQQLDNERNQKLLQDVEFLRSKDKLLNELEEKRMLGRENVIEQKLKTATNNLNEALKRHDYTHPIVLESILNVSKLTYSLGRHKDSKNLVKRVQRDVEKMSSDNEIAIKFRYWIEFLNNIDT